jgi:circadian clock protein KaiC
MVAPTNHSSRSRRALRAKTHQPALPSRIRLQGKTVEKARTGIKGFDDITNGGLPKGRPSLICGTAGCGKTLFGMEFLVHGATEFNEAGVFVAFEETAEELAKNVASLGFDLEALVRQKKLLVDHVHIERSEIQETGEFDLEGLFIRLGYAIDTIGAKRVVLDTIEALFSGLPNEMILRAELRRLFRWLKDKGVTAVITAERGEGTLTRYGLEEYVADCVVLLDHRITEQMSTRRLRVVKYRGSLHGTNEYPFLIGAEGLSVLPISSLGLNHVASSERLSSGVTKLDAMLDGKGFFRGSSILLTGTAGTGKSSLAASFVAAACRRKERALYFAFEESPNQIVRNMRSIGLRLQPFVQQGLLQFHAARPTFYGLEMHLVSIHELVNKFKPSVVVFDPVTNLTAVGTEAEVSSTLTRLLDFLKTQQITSLFTSLTSGGAAADQSEVGVSSLMDTWLLLRNLESGGERNRGLYVLKSRGMSHSNQVREFIITSRGIDLVEPYLGADEVLIGSARLAQEARDRAAARECEQTEQGRQRELNRKRKQLESQIDSLQEEIKMLENELSIASEERQVGQAISNQVRSSLAELRGAMVRRDNSKKT